MQTSASNNDVCFADSYLFVGSQTGGRSAAIVYTLLETAKLNLVD